MPDGHPTADQLVDVLRALAQEQEIATFDGARAVFERRRWLVDVHRSASVLDAGPGVPVRVRKHGEWFETLRHTAIAPGTTTR